MKRWLPVILIAVASCGGTGADAGGPRDMTPGGVCAYYAERFCPAEQKCFPLLFANLGYGDITTCNERLKVSCVSRLTANGVRDTPDRVVQCANALAGLSCDAYLDYEHWPEACTIPLGDLADGDPCIVPGQCKGGSCAITSRMACGTCQTLSPVGGSCASDLDCLGSLPCVNGICTDYRRLGEPCGDLNQCAVNLACRGRDATGTGTCAKTAAAGGACDPDSVGYECDVTQALGCDPEKRTCQPQAPLPGAGELCDSDFCNAVSLCLNGTCRRKSLEGQPCGSSTDCLVPARCIENVCKIRDAAVCK